MKNKKYLAWFIDSNDNKLFNANVLNSNLLINKICEKFEKIYIINFNNLKLFSNKKSKFNFELDKNLQLPNNIEFFYPFNSKDFKSFMIGKELIGINSIGRNFTDLKIHFLLARHNIKQVQIAYLGNIQGTPRYIKNFLWKYLLLKIKYIFGHKFTVFLSNLGLISKMEIRFHTNRDIIEYSKKGKNFYNKIFNYFKLHFAKEFIPINSRSFDQIKESTIKVEENQIVLLDEMLNDIHWTRLRKSLDEKSIAKHYFHLEKLMKHLSDIYNKKIVVCIHPMDDLKLKKKYFPDFEVVQYQTKENIFKAFIVVFFESSAIVDAILLKKKIITVLSNYLDESQKAHNLRLHNKIGITKINIEDGIPTSKNDFLIHLNNITENYSDHIKSYIAQDENNLGYEKIIKTLKERFFN